MSADDFFNRMLPKKPPAESQPEPETGRREPKQKSGRARREAAVARRQRQLAERFLDNEALTAGLDDEAANALIDWGMDLSQRIAASTRDLPDEQAQSRLEQRGAAAQDLIRSAREWVLYPAAQPPPAPPLDQPPLAAGSAPHEELSPADVPGSDPDMDQFVPPTSASPASAPLDENWQTMTRLAVEAYGETLASPETEPGLESLQPGAPASPAERIRGLRRLLEPGASTSARGSHSEDRQPGRER